MKILSKASCDINQIEDRIEKGFSNIEIQFVLKNTTNKRIL